MSVAKDHYSGSGLFSKTTGVEPVSPGGQRLAKTAKMTNKYLPKCRKIIRQNAENHL